MGSYAIECAENLSPLHEASLMSALTQHGEDVLCVAEVPLAVAREKREGVGHQGPARRVPLPQYLGEAGRSARTVRRRVLRRRG